MYDLILGDKKHKASGCIISDTYIKMGDFGADFQHNRKKNLMTNKTIIKYQSLLYAFLITNLNQMLHLSMSKPNQLNVYFEAA